jgi:hypothetical protein
MFLYYELATEGKKNPKLTDLSTEYEKEMDPTGFEYRRTGQNLVHG